jgi:hypothetical protein
MKGTRVYLLVVAAGALGGLLGGVAGAAVTAVEERNGRMVVEVRFESRTGSTDGALFVTTPGLPALRFERFYVALPGDGSFSVTPLVGAAEERRSGLPPIVANPDTVDVFPGAPARRGFYPASPVVVSAPFVFRKSRVIAVDCYASQVDSEAGIERRWSGYRVVVTYESAAAVIDAERADPLLAALVINDLVFPASRGRAAGETRIRGSAAGVSDPHFSLSPNWIKVFVDSAGVYSIDGDDLAVAGVDPSEIDDPSSFRLFTFGGHELERTDASGFPFTDAGGTWRPGVWMTECAILVEDGADGTFDPADRIIFYGIGSHGWADLYGRGSPRHVYLDHRYVRENVYYLTWDDIPGFPGSPRRMAPQAAAPVGGGPDVTSFEERLFTERNILEVLAFGGDGWVWLEATPKSGIETLTLFPNFEVFDLVTSEPQTFRTVASAPFKTGEVNQNHHAEYLVNGIEIGDIVFDSTSKYESADSFEVTGSILANGSNQLRLRLPRDLNARDFMYFESFEVTYTRMLRARGGRLLFSAFETPGPVDFEVTNFTPAESVYVVEVSDQYSPRSLNGVEETDAGGRRGVRFSVDVGSDPAYFWAGDSSALESPVRIARIMPRELRDLSEPIHMVVLCHPAFRSAANRFKSHRAARYPYSIEPRIEVVTTEEVYDNFSGGLVDPMAIRNYCKFLYDNNTDDEGDPALAFLLLLGDANIDSRNYITPQENFVPTNLNMGAAHSDPYATDDWFAELEELEIPPNLARKTFLQIGVGRLPAGSSSDAFFLVNRVIDYETRAEFGPWRDRVVLVADDEVTPNRPPETSFTEDSESIARSWMSRFLDPVRIYLTEFPRVGSVKPASRLKFIEEWNEGALVINYIGHGSSVQMADEQVFLGSDVANLRNGLRLPLFMAFSCTIGDFGRAQTTCLAEKLFLWQSGGAVAAVTASEVSYIGPNTSLNTWVFREFTPDRPGKPEPIGISLMRAKNTVVGAPVDSAYNAPGVQFLEENDQKYNLLGDPSLLLSSPTREVLFDSADVDTLTAGKRTTLRGTVLKDGSPDPGFNGKVDLLVREPDDTGGYPTSVPPISYRYPGGTIYRGTADVSGGSFEFSFKVPRFALTGPFAFLRAYADNGSIDAVVLKDDAHVAAPAPEDTTVLHPIDGPPRVDMGFKGGQTIVKPGAVLEAKIRDADGINILNTTPEGKVAIVFDDTNLPLDVTSSFEFDQGGTDTSGVLVYPIPDLPVGEHQVVLKVADSFGLVTLDTLGFAMTDPSDYAAEVVFNYPNPFTSSTHFLLNLTDPADVQVDIFTVSGKRVRTLRGRESAGEAWIFWDGLDSAGDAIANGTYLYVARVNFVGLDRTPLTLRGKIVKIG